ncbi:hypothetical protein FGIG_00308 [Fasciola gigantica]|uniref:Uncharacterized protein n=1 Tax=Fasciola gigantica TaxID=46835 RepID=A0A504X729_FASGI|nr:hypothetical protein FGIG_00308 [Fasciola gigantica]
MMRRVICTSVAVCYIVAYCSSRCRSTGIPGHRSRSSMQNLEITIQDIISPLDEEKRREFMSQSTAQEKGLGNLYLFNSLPQPTPVRISQNGAKFAPEIDPNTVMLSDFIGGQLERVSVDWQCLQPLSLREIKTKALLSNSGNKFNFPASEICFENNSANSAITNQCSISSEKSPAFLYPQPTAPLDLGGYELMSDLSASFEASLLASLKEAAMGPSNTRYCDTEHSRQKLPSDTGNPERASSPDETNPSDIHHTAGFHDLPVPQRVQALPIKSHHTFSHISKPVNDHTVSIMKNTEHHRHLIHKDASFSDQESSLATTTAGLGSLFNFSIVREQLGPGILATRRPSATNDVGFEDMEAMQQRLVPVDPKSSISHTDSLDETSLLITTDNSVASKAFDFTPRNSLKWRLISSGSEPNLKSETYRRLVRIGENHSETDVPSVHQSDNLTGTESECVQDKLVQLLYDPLLDCYYDPKTAIYYGLK